MSVWWALIIPVLVAPVVRLGFHRQILWWEFLLLLVTPVPAIFGAKLFCERQQVIDREVWGGWVTTANYYEHWNQYIHKTCSYTVSCGKDCTTVIYYDCSYVSEHPAYWTVEDSNGAVVPVSETTFIELSARWGSRHFIDMHRNYHTIDGDKYVARFDDVAEHYRGSLYEPTAVVHTFENRVRASRSVLRFPDISKKEADQNGLFDYPPIVDGYKQRCVLGWSGSNADAVDRELQHFNAFFGARKKARVYLEVYRGRSMDAALMQQSYWQGGKKNELHIALGFDQDEQHVEWAYVFGWTTWDTVKTELRNAAVGLPVAQLPAYAAWLTEKLVAEPGQLRRDFREFNYLTVEPPTWAVIATFGFVLMLDVLLAAWAVGNEFEHIGGHWCTRQRRFIGRY